MDRHQRVVLLQHRCRRLAVTLPHIIGQEPHHQRKDCGRRHEERCDDTAEAADGVAPARTKTPPIDRRASGQIEQDEANEDAEGGVLEPGGYDGGDHAAAKRASRTAVWPRLGRRLGITSRQSSCGVRISVSPSSAINVFRLGITSPPRYVCTKVKLL